MWKPKFLSRALFRRNRPRRYYVACILAIVADAVQIGGSAIFAEGAFSPFDDAVDVVVSIILCGLLGWHWALLPTAVAKLVPMLDLFPTWTAAAVFVIKQRDSNAIETASNAIEPVRVTQDEVNAVRLSQPKAQSLEIK